MIEERIERTLSELRRKNRLRYMRSLDEVRGIHGLLKGRRVTIFCSNDYLGLSCHPAVIEEVKTSIERFGIGSGGSRLMTGTRKIHQEVEGYIASLFKKEACLIFSCGYMANLGIIPSVTEEGDTIYSDRLNHASIIDGTRISGRRVRIYPHCDLSSLSEMIHDSKEKGDSGMSLVVTEGLFSVDGDFAPLKGLVNIKDERMLLLIDDAHSFGIWGDGGLGRCEAEGVIEDVDMIVATFGKAIGGFGAFVVCSEQMRELLVNRARTFIFTTAPSPLLMAEALAGIKVMRREVELRERCIENARILRRFLKEEGFPISNGESQIIPLIVGDDESTMRLTESLLEDGFLCQGIRPPTVPEGSSRLRITVTALHEREDMEKFVHALKRGWRAIGFRL